MKHFPLLIVLLATAAQANPIFFAGKWADDKLEHNTDMQGAFYTIRYSTTTAHINKGQVSVKIEQTIQAPKVEATAIIPMPRTWDAEAIGLKILLTDADGKRIEHGKVKRLGTDDDARSVYESIAKATRSVALLSKTSGRALLIPNVKLDGKATLTLEYIAPIDQHQGLGVLDIPMPATAWTKAPVSKLALTVHLNEEQPIRTIFSPTNNITIDRDGLNKAVIRVRADKWSGAEDFRMLYVADKDDLGLRALTFRDDKDEDGYFMVVANPTGLPAGVKPIEKDVVFVMDTSGSMRGEKIEQARAAIEYCLGQLNKGDRFNIITFGTKVANFKKTLAKRSEKNITAARDFVDEIVANGRTNINEALLKGLAGDTTKGRPRIMIFLTDGTPTAGELTAEKIVENATNANKSKTRIFVMGVGHDVNAHLLDKLAENSDGSAEFAEPDEEIDVKVASLYDRLANPLLTDVKLIIDGVKTLSVYPKKLPVLFKGTQFMAFGRFRNSTTSDHTVKLVGTLAGSPREYSVKTTFPAKVESNKNSFVPPLWASRKIGFLLQELRLHGKNQELIDEVVRLSKKFGIVTEYTRFLALAEHAVDPNAARAQTEALIQTAAQQQSGAWAVRQARNDKLLQSKTLTVANENYYVDRAGNHISTDRIKCVGNRVLYLREGRWVDAEETGERKKRSVKLFSDEYFGLLRSNKDFAKAMSAGANVELNVGNERITVVEDKPEKPKEENPGIDSRRQSRTLQQQRIDDPLQVAAPNQVLRQQVNQVPHRQFKFNRLQQADVVQINSRRNVQQVTHQAWNGGLTARAIRTAIDDSVMYLRSIQQPNGMITSEHSGGSHALATLAWLAAGGNPASDPQLRKALDYLLTLNPNNTYHRGVRANVWEYALRKVPHETKYRDALKADYDWLMEALKINGKAWRYTKTSKDYDNSCSQYGVLGIWAASRAGFDPGKEFWKKMSTHFRWSQNGDGGWGYQKGRGSNPNMATAGLASMFLVFDMDLGKNYYSAENPRTFADGDAAAVLDSIARGMKWLGAQKAGKNDGYYLYGIERTGVASGRKYIGGEDWFKTGAATVLRSQRSNGSIPLGRWGTICSSSMCTLFLVYGGAPVAFNKLQYGDTHDWNLNPRDLANVSKYMWLAYESPLNWHTVSIDAPAAEFEAPILFISGSKAARFTDEQVAKLREYIQRGGTIMAEPSDHSKDFAKSMQQLIGRIYPANEYPGHKLKQLPNDHGIYTVLRQQWQSRPNLQGVSDGSRTVFVMSDSYMSADWQMNRIESDSFKLAMNLLFYATDLGTLEGKFASVIPNTPRVQARKESYKMARMIFSNDESPRDWDAGAMSWKTTAPLFLHATGAQLHHGTINLAKDETKDINLIHISGRHTLKLTDVERKGLKQFVTDGGTLLVDAYGGSTTFAKSAAAELESLFGKLKPLANDHVLCEGRFEGGTDLSSQIKFKLPARRTLRQRGESSNSQKLQVAKVDGRTAVIFSEFDLSAAMAGIENYKTAGYKPESARRIAVNIAAYATVD